MAGPTLKLSRELDGNTPEQVAWGLLEWIRLIEEVRDRRGILSAYTESLKSARAGTALATASDEPVTGTQRQLAYRLTHLVAEMEGRSPGQRNQGDRNWVMDTYAECLSAVLGRWTPSPAPEPAA